MEPADLTAILKSRDHYYNHLGQLIKNSEKSILLMTTPQGLSRKLDLLKNHLEKAKKRGVKIQIAVPTQKVADSDMMLAQRFAEVRNVEDVKSRFMIADSKDIAFTLMDETADPTYDAGIWISSKFFVDGFKQMFNLVWKKAKPLAKIN